MKSTQRGTGVPCMGEAWNLGGEALKCMVTALDLG